MPLEVTGIYAESKTSTRKHSFWYPIALFRVQSNHRVGLHFIPNAVDLACFSGVLIFLSANIVYNMVKILFLQKF